MPHLPLIFMSLYSLTPPLLMDIEFLVIFVVCYYKNCLCQHTLVGRGKQGIAVGKTQGVCCSFSPPRALGGLWSHPGSRRRTEPRAGATSASGPTAGELASNPGALSLFSTEPAELALVRTLRPPAALREPRGQAEWPGFPSSLYPSDSIAQGMSPPGPAWRSALCSTLFSLPSCSSWFLSGRLSPPPAWGTLITVLVAARLREADV